MPRGKDLSGMTMRRFLVIAGVVAPLVCGADDPARADITVGGVATITHTAGSRALILNRMNRNDNSFDGLRLNLIGQATLSEHATLNLEYLIDEAALSSQALTYLRPWVRFTDVGNRSW